MSIRKGGVSKAVLIAPSTSAWLCNAVKWEMDSQRLMYFCLSGDIKPSALQEGDEPSLECKKKKKKPIPSHYHHLQCAILSISEQRSEIPLLVGSGNWEARLLKAGSSEVLQTAL